MTIQLDGDGAGGAANRARWLGLALIVVALGGAAWLAHEADEAEAGAPPFQAAPQPSLGEMFGAIEAAQAPQRAASLAAAASAVQPLAADETEVCTLGRVKADAMGQPVDGQPLREAARHAREQVLPRLLASGDEATRAAGLLMQAVGAPGQGAAEPAGDPLARHALSTLALTTRNPQVYAWAMRACQGHRAEGACALLSPEQWARLEPHNAMPWLHVAADAQLRHDQAGVAEALYRLSHAERSDARWGVLTGVVLRHMPSDVTLLGRGALAIELASVDNGAQLPLVAASQYCSEQAVRDANRQQVCTGVAEMLHTRSGTLIEASLAADIGRRVGWPDARLEAARDERDAIAQLSRQGDSTGRWSCLALAQSLSRLSEVARHGEMDTLRAALKRSDVSVAVLAQRQRDAVAAQAAKAASAPAAALP